MAIVMVELRDGRRIEVDSPFETLTDAAAGEPENGVYLAARTYEGDKVLDLDRHFDRVERSAGELGVALRVPRHRLRRELSAMVEALRGVERGPVDGRFRVTAVLDEPPWYRLSAERARDVPGELLVHGVECAIVRGVIRRRGRVKSTAWLSERRRLSALDSARDESADPPYEYLLADARGRILEGASSNFYAVAGDTLYTAAEGVLEGTARRIVLEIAETMLPTIEVRMEPIEESRLGDGTVDEAFLTSSTRGVVPIRAVGPHILGEPGSWTRRIAEAYRRELSRRLEALVP
ncbi:MAG: aminotransferase class IV [Spirochaetales bacterium]|nr:aminotransferase class IV [Spirochaetales bacterium]